MRSKTKSLGGKIMVVVGATGDIGGGLALRLQKVGASVVGVGRDQEKLDSLKILGIHPFQTDCSKIKEVEKLIRDIESILGKPHALITSVGTWRQITIESSSTEFGDQLSADLNSITQAALNPLFAFYKYFKKAGGGFMVDISSHVVEKNLPGNLTYASAKAAVRAFINNLREENKYLDSNVTITQIVAQLVDTRANRTRFSFDDKEWRGAVSIDAMARWIRDNIDNPNIPPEKFFASKLLIP